MYIDTGVFFLRIGYNNGINSQIYDYSTYGFSFSTHATSIIDCNCFKDFWMSWDDYTIEAGIGGVAGTNTFITYTSDTVIPPVAEVRVRSYEEAYWIF